MVKILALETNYERFLRVRAEEICKSYLAWSDKILSGQVSPNRIIAKLAGTKGMTREAVRRLLIRKGIYQDAQHPVLVDSNGNQLVPIPAVFSHSSSASVSSL